MEITASSVSCWYQNSTWWLGKNAGPALCSSESWPVTTEGLLVCTVLVTGNPTEPLRGVASQRQAGLWTGTVAPLCLRCEDQPWPLRASASQLMPPLPLPLLTAEHPAAFLVLKNEHGPCVLVIGVSLWPDVAVCVILKVSPICSPEKQKCCPRGFWMEATQTPHLTGTSQTWLDFFFFFWWQQSQCIWHQPLFFLRLPHFHTQILKSWLFRPISKIFWVTSRGCTGLKVTGFIFSCSGSCCRCWSSSSNSITVPLLPHCPGWRGDLHREPRTVFQALFGLYWPHLDVTSCTTVDGREHGKDRGGFSAGKTNTKLSEAHLLVYIFRPRWLTWGLLALMATWYFPASF